MKNVFYNVNELYKVEVETEHTEFVDYKRLLNIWETIVNYLTFQKGNKKAYYYIVYIDSKLRTVCHNVDKLGEAVEISKEYNDGEPTLALIDGKVMNRPYVKLFFNNNSIATRYFDTEAEVKEYVKHIIALKPSLSIELFSANKV